MGKRKLKDLKWRSNIYICRGRGSTQPKKPPCFTGQSCSATASLPEDHWKKLKEKENRDLSLIFHNIFSVIYFLRLVTFS